MVAKVVLKENLLTICIIGGKMWEFFFYLYPPHLSKSALQSEKTDPIGGKLR